MRLVIAMRLILKMDKIDIFDLSCLDKLVNECYDKLG